MFITFELNTLVATKKTNVLPYGDKHMEYGTTFDVNIYE